MPWDSPNIPQNILNMPRGDIHPNIPRNLLNEYFCLALAGGPKERGVAAACAPSQPSISLVDHTGNDGETETDNDETEIEDCRQS